MPSERWGTAERRAFAVGVRPCPAAWTALLACERVVLCCYCTDPERCHRSLLARILGKLGAHVEGEIGLLDAIATVLAAAEAGDTITPRTWIPSLSKFSENPELLIFSEGTP